MLLELLLSALLAQGQTFDPEIEPSQDSRLEKALRLPGARTFDPELDLPQDPKAEPKPELKSALPEGKSPIDVWFEDGLRFKSRDGNFEGRIGGRFLTHYRTIFDRPADTAAPLRDLPNTFFVRQARLEFEGTILKDWGFKVQVDFGSGITSQSTGTAGSNVTGTLRDGFIEYKRWKEFTIRMGQWLEPLSQEDYSSTRFIDFAERSPMNRFLPGRELGIQFYGTLFESVLDYFLVITNGQATLNDGGRAVNDANDQKEGILAFRVRPFQNSGNDWLKGLRMSIAGSYGIVDDIATGALDIITTELSVMYLDSVAAGPQLDGTRRRIVPAISWPIGPFCFRGEYIYRTDDLPAGAPVEALRMKGWYAYVTFILTGENKKPEDRIVPMGDWGAVELAFRVAQAKIQNAFESTIFAPAGNAELVTTYTFGVNWWVTRNVRLTLDIIREKYSDPLLFDARTESKLMGAIFRAQIDF